MPLTLAEGGLNSPDWMVDYGVLLGLLLRDVTFKAPARDFPFSTMALLYNSQRVI